MIWNTVNVLTTFCAGKIAGKLAWKILNELGVCWVGIGLVLCPFPCDVFAMYQPRTLPLAPSERGLIEQMEEEAAKMGLGGLFNGEIQTRLLESWSGPNSDTLDSQDQVRTTELTIIGGWTLPNPVRVPDSLTCLGILIPLMEGPI